MADNPNSNRLFEHIYGSDPEPGALDAYRVGASNYQVQRLPETRVNIPTLQIYDESINLVRSFDSNSAPAKVYRSNQDSVVRIKTIDRELENGDRVTSDGTGFFVTRDGTLATDYHVVKDARGGISVQTTDGRVYNAVISAVDPKHDLALLQVQRNNRYEVLDFQPASLSPSSAALRSGQNVDAMGFPLSSDLLHISPGTFTTTKSLNDFNLTGGLLPGEDPGRRIFTSTMNVQRGNSGGPIFAESDGAVVGVVGLSNKDGTLAIGTPVEDLLNLLDRTRGIQRPGAGSAIASLLQPGVATNFGRFPAAAAPAYYNFPRPALSFPLTAASTQDGAGSAIKALSNLPSFLPLDSQSRYNAPPALITRKLGY